MSNRKSESNNGNVLSSDDEKCRVSLRFNLEMGLLSCMQIAIIAGYNVGVGVFGTDNLTLNDNIIHHTVGPAIDLGGRDNKLVHNLVIMSLAEATFKVSRRVRSKSEFDSQGRL